MNKLQERVEALRTNHPFCSQCGSQMKASLGGFFGNILVWECGKFLKFGLHDYRTHGYVEFDQDMPKFDVKTGEKL